VIVNNLFESCNKTYGQYLNDYQELTYEGNTVYDALPPLVLADNGGFVDTVAVSFATSPIANGVYIPDIQIPTTDARNVSRTFPCT